MPKAAVLSHLQSVVRERVRVGSACELGRAADLHRSTVLRFCESGRATSRTAQKLQNGLTALASGHGPSQVASRENLVLTNQPSASLEIPQELKALRSMLQTLIALIDGQIPPPSQADATNSQAADHATFTSSQTSMVGGST